MIAANCRTSRSVALSRSANEPHFVYHCFDADDRLLYVGCTSNVKRRIAQHQHAKPGAALASRVLSICMTRVEVVGEYRDRDTARRVEALQIQQLKPVLNFQATWTPGWMTNGLISRYLAEHDIAIEDVGLRRCQHCQILRPYRDSADLCSDCRDPEFRAYIDLQRGVA